MTTSRGEEVVELLQEPGCANSEQVGEKYVFSGVAKLEIGQWRKGTNITGMGLYTKKRVGCFGECRWVVVCFGL